MGLRCRLFKHTWMHIANFRDASVERGLYQCTKCKDITMDAPSEYHERRKKQGKYTRINNGD